jgi:hypothetical protein
MTMNRLQILSILTATSLVGGLFALNYAQKAQATVEMWEIVGTLMCAQDNAFMAEVHVATFRRDGTATSHSDEAMCESSSPDPGRIFFTVDDPDALYYKIHLMCTNFDHSKDLTGMKKLGQDVEKKCNIDQHYAELDLHSKKVYVD